MPDYVPESDYVGIRIDPLVDFLTERITEMRATLPEPQTSPATGRPIAPRCGQPDCTSRNCRRTEDDFLSNGYDIYGYDRDGYDEYGWDQNGYDREGYNRRGFSRTEPYLHRNGASYDDAGFNRYGYDRDGYDPYGRNIDGYDREGYDYDGYDSDGRDRYGDERQRCDSCESYYCEGDCESSYCESCDSSYCDGDCRYGMLHSYSYTPALEFMGDSGPYYGMEIEVTLDNVSRGVDIVNEAAGTLTTRGNPLVYCKSDSSVDGMEMVTHPMSYDWAMAEFPWDMLAKLRTDASARVITSENGIHVHVGRSAFSSAAHLYRWFKLWYRNPDDMQRIGRRRSSHWGSFNPEHRTGQKNHVMRGKPGYRRGDDATLRDRYSAINTTNDSTLEVRIFASTLNPVKARAALQLVAASVEYTRQLSPADICQRNGWAWDAFMSWVTDDGRYPDLVSQNRTRQRV